MESETKSTTLEVVKGTSKALLGGAVAFVGAVAVGYADGVMTTGEWWAAAGAGLVALAGVYGVPTSGEFAPER